jgi:hypothetical protein
LRAFRQPRSRLWWKKNEAESDQAREEKSSAFGALRVCFSFVRERDVSVMERPKLRMGKVCGGFLGLL